MKKILLKILLLLLFLNLMPIVKASILLEDWVNDMETFKAGDHYFYVQYIESTQNVIFKMDGTGGIMLMGECETREDIRYCFEEVNYPQIKVKIEYLEPDISLERSFSTTSPYLNEEITVTVILKNNGDKGATNVKYLDIYPGGLKVFSNKNAGEWEGNLPAGEEEKFTYTIKAGDIVSFDSTATLSYKFEGKEKTKKSSTEKINVIKPYNISHEISKEAADKDEIIAYNITLINKDQSNQLSIENLEITLPSKIDLVSASNELKREDGKLTFKGAIDKKTSKNFAIKIKSSMVGKFIIHSSANLKISDKTFKEELEKPFSIGLSYVLPIVDIPNEVKSNSPYTIYIAVKNYGGEDIKNVKIKVESDLFTALNETKDIKAGATNEILKKSLTSPYLSEDRKFNTKVIGSYISSSGRTLTFEKSSQLTVKAQPQIIQIIRELNKEEFYPGDKISITIKVKNQRNQIINGIDVSDIFPKEIRSSLVGNVTAYLESLNPNEEKEAYSYSLIIPKDYKGDEIEFKTTINTKFNEELVILKRTDKIKILKGEKPKEGQKEIKGNETEKGDLNKTEEETIKENFFKKIINWVKNLFKKKREISHSQPLELI